MKKRFLSLLILPLIAIFAFYGCKDTKSVAEVKKNYTEMVSSFVEEDKNIFFSDESRPNSIVIRYIPDVQKAIAIENPVNDLQKRYCALGYQQKILDNIFGYYEATQADFYTKAESRVDGEKLNILYEKVSTIKNTLRDFKLHYDTFNDAVSIGTGNIMVYSITSYSYYLNKVIEASFDFINYYEYLYATYCIEEYDVYSADKIKIYVDKAYLDLSYIVYMENIKAFNFSTGENGMCDLAPVIRSASEFNILDTISVKKSASLTILENYGINTELGMQSLKALNDFAYSRDVFEQRIKNYKTNYAQLDVYKINQYRFGQMNEVDYESYLNTLSASKRATVVMLENFINNTFLTYLDKLNKIVE